MGVKQIAFKIKWVHAVPLLGTLVLVLGTPFIDNPYYLDTLITILLWAGLAGAWNIVGGYAGQLSLGHGAFFGIGAYTSTVLFLRCDLSPFVGLLAGALLAMLVAVGIGAVCFRLKGPFFVLATLAFGEVAHIAAINWRSITGGTNGLQIPYNAGWLNFTFLSEKPYVYIALLYLIIVYALNKYMEHSRLGYQLVGIREDEEASRSLGVSSWRAKLSAFGISAFLTALGGTFYAQYIQIIDPDSTFSWTVSIQPALLTIVGGLGTAAGPILGSLIMIPISQIIRVQLGGTYSGAHLVVYAVVLIVIVLFLPRGLYDVVRKALSEVWEKLFYEVTRNKTAFLQKLLEAKTERIAMLEVQNVIKKFGGLFAVNGVNLSVRKGETVGLMGPNGAGKTTLFNLLTGFLRLDSGTIIFKKQDIRSMSPEKLCKKGICRTFQIVRPFGAITVLDNVVIGALNRSKHVAEAREIANENIKLVGLAPFTYKEANSLTLGYRKRLEVARALATRPELLLLDEVMAGLNPTEVKEMIDLVARIRELGITLFVIEHIMEAIMSICDRIVVLNYGSKLAEGKPVDIAKNPQVIQAYLGEEYELT